MMTDDRFRIRSTISAKAKKDQKGTEGISRIIKTRVRNKHFHKNDRHQLP